MVDFPDRTVIANSDQVLTCAVTGLSADTTVTWVDPSNNEISDSDTNNYVLNQGNYIGGSKEFFLTIKKVVIQSLAETTVYKCKVKSALYPVYSPETVNEMTLTALTLGKLSILKPLI